MATCDFDACHFKVKRVNIIQRSGKICECRKECLVIFVDYFINNVNFVIDVL